MISFILIVNKQSQTRFSKYSHPCTIQHQQRSDFELGLSRECIQREGQQNYIFDYHGVGIAHRRYASLYFILGFADENPFAMLELIQFCVECLEEQVDRVSELDILFNLDKVHVIMDEIIMNGMVVESNRKRAVPQMT
ncbi:unnamed protein product [Umbelopsis ramanniana]